MTSIKEGVTELRHLRYFLAVAETGNFHRAAASLHVSQPTLSHQIKQLEAQMGAILLERLSRTIRLTAAGEILRARSLVMFRELEDARRGIAELQSVQSGQLRVGIVSTVNVAVVPEAVSAFRNRHPKVSVSIRELPMETLESELLAGRLDLGISFLSAKNSSRLETEPLFVESLVAILPERHALEAQRKITLADMLAQPLVLLSHGFCTRELVVESVALQRLDHQLNPAVEMNSIEGVLSTIRQTGMVTLLPESAVQWAKHPDLQVRALADDAGDLSFRRVGLVWTAGGHRTAAARAFAEEVKAIIQRDGVRPPVAKKSVRRKG
ncbi:MAG: LysR substrate-binding domain-containing protein [Verrucomicrobium sp.]